MRHPILITHHCVDSKDKKNIDFNVLKTKSNHGEKSRWECFLNFER